jgi:hypothetical protein
VPAAPGYPAKLVVREDPLPGSWSLVDVECQLNGQTPSSRFHVTGGEVTMTLYDLDDASCTYTNRRCSP